MMQEIKGRTQMKESIWKVW